MTKPVEVIPGVPMKAYRDWLENPVTRAVYEHMERQSRPLANPVDSGVTAALRLGFAAGVWHGLDAPRSLMVNMLQQQDDPTATYEQGELNI